MFVPAKWFYASRLNLLGLLFIRILVLALQAFSIAICYVYQLFVLPWNILIIMFTGSFILCLLTALRLTYFSWPITDKEYAVQLMCDITMHCALLYCTGGPSNPFISYFLVPITIAAVTLPWKYTLYLVTYSVVGYSFLWAWNIPLQVHYAWEKSSLLLINLHLVGMWLSFTFSTLLIGVFVSQMAMTLRQQDRKIAEWREEELHNQQLLAVATQAAGAAHELGTPLSTMTVLLKDLEETYVDDKPLYDDLLLLQTQVQLCKDSLQQLVRAAEADRLNDIKLQIVTHWLQGILQRWHLMHPEISYQYQCTGQGKLPMFKPHTTITQAVLNILNNAADAAPEDIEINLNWNNDNFIINIHDNGAGIPAYMEKEFPEPFITSKRKGFGLGLFLSHVSIIRAGGDLKLYNHEVQGTIAVLQLPYNQNSE